MYQQTKHTLSCIAENSRCTTLEENLEELFVRADGTVDREELLAILAKYGMPRKVAGVLLRRLVEDGVLWCSKEQCKKLTAKRESKSLVSRQFLSDGVQQYNKKIQEILHVQYGIEVALVEAVVQQVAPDDIVRLQKLMGLLKDALYSEVETTLVLRECYEELFTIADNAMLNAMSAQMLVFFEEGRERYIAEAANRKTLYGHMMRIVRFLSEYDEIGACASIRGQLARIQTYYSVYCS